MKISITIQTVFFSVLHRLADHTTLAMRGGTECATRSGEVLTDGSSNLYWKNKFLSELKEHDNAIAMDIKDKNLTFSVQELSRAIHLENWVKEKNFTKEQIQVMNSLREKIIEKHSLDSSSDSIHSFSRFCEAQAWDLDGAVSMLENHLAWRESHKLHGRIEVGGNAYNTSKYLIDFATSTEFHRTKGVSFTKFHKVDKIGRPVVYHQLKLFDPNKVSANSSYKNLIDLFIWEQEFTLEYRLPAASIQAKKLISLSLNVVDMNGFKLQSFNADGRSFMKEIASIGSNQYPFTMGAIYVINAPFFFRIIWTFLSPLLPKRVKDVIYILGNREEYLPLLHEVIDEDNLPSFLGGIDESFELKKEIGPWAQWTPPILADALKFE